jgi:ubiquinone/menaquinone biosynthesis C-methylase UbiE
VAEPKGAPVQFTDGKAYETFMGRWSRLAGRKFLSWVNPPKGLNWIDVGCGNGAFTEELIAHAAPASVTGVDPSEGQISFARSRFNAGKVDLRIADACALPFADNSFDAASMALVIVFVSDPAKAASELARVVKPGGIAATYMWDMPGGGFPHVALSKALQSLDLPMPSRPNPDAANRDVMLGIWEKAGFHAVETEVIRIETVYADAENYWQSATVPGGPSAKAIDDLSPADKARLKARLREILPSAPDGRIVFEAFANAVKGRVPA